MQPGREADYGQVHQLPGDVISSGARLATARALVVDGDRGGVDDGDRASVGGVGDRRSDLCGTANGVGDKVASSLHCRVLVRLGC